MHDEMTQRMFFWMLKRWSSVTFWRYILKLQTSFMSLIEQQVMNYPDDDPPGFEIDIYNRTLEDVINIKKGITKLESGNRSVFMRKAKDGFTRCGEGYGLLWELLSRENMFETPELLIKSGDRLLSIAREIDKNYTNGLSVCEIKSSSKSPRWYASALIDECNRSLVAFPGELSPVPEAGMPSITVPSGEELPKNGIYKPIGEGTCMCYLLAGTVAPMAASDVLQAEIPTKWKLLWEDRRYEDEGIPEEENDYFLPIQGKENTSIDVLPEKLRVLPGDTCLREGYWWTPAKEDGRRYFKRGDVFPDFPASDYGATVWYFDREQDS
jgi:hypothetical protein